MFKLRNVKYKNILEIEALDISAGMVTCILGESGAGKTTFLKLLNKMITCDQGEIFYKDKLIKEIDPVALRRKVVMLSQTPAIFDGSIRFNLLLGLKYSEKGQLPDQALSKMLREVKLEKDLDDNADKLSGGEKKRIALARIMLMDPEVLLLDEPSSSLDQNTEISIIEMLVNYVKEAGKTLVMVTHSKNIADVFADAIVTIPLKNSNGGGYNE